MNRFEPVEALGGLEVGPISVGQGTGATELGLEYVEQYGTSNALEFGYEYESEAAWGRWWASQSASPESAPCRCRMEIRLRIAARSAASTCSTADNRYEFGLFTYLQSLCHERTNPDGELETVCQEIEVVNYWIHTD